MYTYEYNLSIKLVLDSSLFNAAYDLNTFTSAGEKQQLVHQGLFQKSKLILKRNFEYSDFEVITRRYNPHKTNQNGNDVCDPLLVSLTTGTLGNVLYETTIMGNVRNNTWQHYRSNRECRFAIMAHNRRDMQVYLIAPSIIKIPL